MNHPRKKSKLIFWLSAAGFVFFLFNSLNTYSTYQDKAKQQAAATQQK